MLSILGLILTIVFGALSIYLYLKSRRYKQIVFTHLFSTLQTRNHPDISISFSGKEINNLSKLLVLCWNAGTEEIRGTDVPSANPPAIVFPENVTLLSYKLLDASSEGLNFSLVKPNDRLLNFTFEYLNPNDGGLIEVLYEQSGDDLGAINIEAHVIGGRPSLDINYEPRSGWGWIVTVSVSALLAAAIGIFFLWVSMDTAGVTTVVLVLCGLIELVLSAALAYAFWYFVQLYNRQRIPHFAVEYLEGRS